jgi:AcrR family transcriptional regulator
MTDIAREAGVSERTVQRHFGSKDQLLAAALRFPAKALAEELNGRPAAESVEGAIARLVDAMFAIYNRHRPELWAAYSHSAHVPELMRAQSVAVVAWLAAVEDLFSRWPDVWAIDPATAKRAVIAFTSYPTWRGFAATGGFGPPEAERFITDVLCRYLLRESQTSQQKPS